MSAAASPRRTQAQRSATTRGAIVAAAGRLFAERGFDATGIEDIARAAGVSKGALYHHYPDKVEILAAVYEAVEQKICERLLVVTATETDPLGALKAGIAAFLDACLDPAIRRIALVEAPAGLGWERWRTIDAEYGFGLLLAGLQAAADHGRISDQHLTERAQILLAAVIEASLLLGSSDDQTTTRLVAGEMLNQIIDTLGQTGPELRGM